MRSIRSKFTEPERIMIDALSAKGMKMRLHYSDLPGKPDIVFEDLKIAVFVDSEFWHGRKDHFVYPKSNCEYWKNKIESNKERDKKNNRNLRKMGWLVIRIWESNIRSDVNKCVKRIEKRICKRKADLSK
ncbi:MAG: very short patch repair endonuclease [Deltaproteobacteria bacterium]|nr:very short patch repair endonuclease [Deltaproteobacteria bacterium]